MGNPSGLALSITEKFCHLAKQTQRGPDGSIAGDLVDFSDYDLVVQMATWQKVDPDCKWASVAGGNIVIDRAAVVWINTGHHLDGEN